MVFDLYVLRWSPAGALHVAKDLCYLQALSHIDKDSLIREIHIATNIINGWLAVTTRADFCGDPV